MDKPNLGLATTRELLNELTARIEVDGKLDYRTTDGIVAGTTVSEAPKPERTDGKRAVRTKSTGDRVYLIDDNAKTKAWITSPDMMTKLGFEMSDVQDVEDSELISYQMAPSIYRIDE